MVNKNLPDDSFIGGVWKYSPAIVTCAACRAQGTSIGQGHGWRQVNGLTVCDRDVCYDTVVEMFRKAMEERMQASLSPPPPPLHPPQEEPEVELEVSEDEAFP